MKKLMLLFSFMAIMFSCEKGPEDMSANADDLPAKANTKDGENPNEPVSSKDPDATSKPTEYYFAGYQVSKTVGSEKLGMNVAKKAPDNLAYLNISGYSFVNMYGATYTHNEADGSIKNTEVITTEMAGPAEAMKAEDEFYKNLSKATKVIFEANQVKLLVGNPATEVLIFKKR
ncbi:META domain-containing protein [Emticicia agri]|uniref:META domain-containing protein n=1 Tax=Emticicia agri TaxID=2492393 RepID=A0A4Q5M5P3_9BACT|nr:META domain-containing protein [Emticicia agri]RYU97585.1 META domain-containing protein [Emticicia agri]